MAFLYLDKFGLSKDFSLKQKNSTQKASVTNPCKIADLQMEAFRNHLIKKFFRHALLRDSYSVISL
jgi:hypothetical protein